MYQQCYPSYANYYQTEESYGDTSDMTSIVMTGGDLDLSLTSTTAPMEVADNVAPPEDEEVVAATATLERLITTEPPEGSDDHQHT